MRLIRVFSVAIFLVLFLAAAISSYAQGPTIVVQWNQAVLQGVRDSTLGPPMVVSSVPEAVRIASRQASTSSRLGFMRHTHRLVGSL